MKFKMNGDKWEIKEISNEEMGEIESSDLKTTFTHGTTRYVNNTIYLNKMSPNKEKTLYHELVHCYLYEYGFNSFDKEYNVEDVCEIAANSSGIINKIMQEYFRN